MAFALTVVGVASAEQTASAVTHTVSLKNLQYNPAMLTVNVGDTVTWSNDETSDTTHSVTGGMLNSPDLTPGTRYSFTFTGPGTYAYRSRLHPDMVGQVIVGGGPVPTTAPMAPMAPMASPPTSTATGPTGSPSPATTATDPAGKDLGDGTQLATYQVVNGVKVFHLRAAPIRWEVSPGRVKEAYAFNGLVPGPVIRVNEGDRLRIVVQNDLPEPTSVHWHGMQLPNDQDGVPGLTQFMIDPGQSYTYEWTAVSAGTHWYHSHMGGDQEGKGLYGALEVIPRTGEIRADRDYRILMGDGPLGFVFNGKSFPATVPLKARVGERVHIRLIGTGPEMIHPIHVHGGYFEVVAQDGNPLPIPQRMDTVLVGVGQTYDLIYVPRNPGKWMIHCHIFSHAETPQGMAGLVSILEVDPPVVPLPQLPALPSLLPLLPGLLGQG